VPVPDALARDYILLALRLDQHLPGLVDAYVGPADLKARTELEDPPPPARLRAAADDLLARLPTEAAEPDRRAWLEAQVIALATHAARLDGESLPYREFVRRCLGVTPERREEARFDRAAAEIEAALPRDVAPGEPLVNRLAAWDAGFEVPPGRVLEVAAWLVDRVRAATADLVGLPAGESVSIGLVRGQPWTAFCWFDGAGRSRIDLNVDLPIRARDLVHVIAHETYPGHHAEHAWKERELVEGAGRLEASILLIDAPECVISEGLADVGVGLAWPPDREVDGLLELHERAGLAIAADPAAARTAAEITARLVQPRRVLSEARLNAALLRHADGADRDAVVAYLEAAASMPRERAEKSVDFLDHPLWRPYLFAYHDGEALLRQWLEAVPVAARPARFGRLLREPLTPAAVAAEVGATQFARSEPTMGASSNRTM
jgi:hypothetical protein